MLNSIEPKVPSVGWKQFLAWPLFIVLSTTTAAADITGAGFDERRSECMYRVSTWEVRRVDPDYKLLQDERELESNPESCGLFSITFQKPNSPRDNCSDAFIADIFGAITRQNEANHYDLDTEREAGLYAKRYDTDTGRGRVLEVAPDSGGFSVHYRYERAVAPHDGRFCMERVCFSATAHNRLVYTKKPVLRIGRTGVSVRRASLQVLGTPQNTKRITDQRAANRICDSFIHRLLFAPWMLDHVEGGRAMGWHTRARVDLGPEELFAETGSVMQHQGYASDAER